jgi:hypothetical protein
MSNGMGLFCDNFTQDFWDDEDLWQSIIVLGNKYENKELLNKIKNYDEDTRENN